MTLADLKTKTRALLSARVWILAALVLLLTLMFLVAAGVAVRNSWAAADLREQLQAGRFAAADSAPDEPAPPPQPEPGPVPPRPTAPRAAVRPQPASPPAAPAQTTSWGTTDLDRAIAAFPSTLNLQQEPAK